MAGRPRRRDTPPGKVIELQVESLSHEGRGVAYRDGKVMFVEGALPGETVRAETVRRRGRFDELKAVEVMRAAPQRVTPPCPVAAQCGGCSLQHLETGAQLTFKQSVLLEKLEHATGIGRGEFTLLPPVASAGLHYRRKARLAVRMVASKGGALVGFREKHSNFITAMDDCPVLHEAAGALVAPLKQLIGSLHGGRHISQIELAVGERDARSRDGRVALVLRHMRGLSGEDLDTLVRFAAGRGLHLYLQPGGPESVHKIYPGQETDRLSYFLPASGLGLQFHPLDFIQVNGEVNRLIVAQALEQLRLSGSDRVLDLYCGIGNFTLAIARHVKQVLGVEGSEELLARARDNATLNGIDNCEFHAADLSRPMQTTHWPEAGFNKVLLDPPRSGAIEVMPRLSRLGVERVVYISCNPATLARDAGFLLAGGYRLNSAGVMDMFPNTTHVESMAVFSRR